MKILCLSNGHGEDLIAVRILEQLQQLAPSLELSALPIVGEGHAYEKLNIPIISKVQQMPSGGFIYMDSRQLLRDVKGGLIKLTLNQYQGVRQWAKQAKLSGDRCLVLAVGDLVPLLFAWASGLNYAFVGTAKSEYYLRDDSQWLEKTSYFERLMGGVYLPWERWLMKQSQCQGVFPRDELTTNVLLKNQIRAYNFGNPMMDGLEECFNSELIKNNQELNLVLIPGSRVPEVYNNWQLILEGISQIFRKFPQTKFTFYTAIAPSVPLEPLTEILINQNWQLTNNNQGQILDQNTTKFTQETAQLLLLKNQYQYCLKQGEIALAMAGTATEQFVGLGKPVISIIGKGPQFTPAFAEAQTRLLGKSVILAKNPQQTPIILEQLLTDLDLQKAISINGKKRMGEAGSAKKIADFLLKLLTGSPNFIAK